MVGARLKKLFVYWVVTHVFLKLIESCMRMGCSPARFSYFQIESSSGCSLIWIICIEIKSYSSQCLIFIKILGCSPCVLEFVRLVREWVEARLGYQS